jgi:small subunit ribosomal protein S21
MKIFLKPNEKIQQALRRFKKLLDKEGITKEIKRQLFYESPSQIRSRVRRKAERDREREVLEQQDPNFKKKKEKKENHQRPDRRL